MSDLTAVRLREMLLYNPDNGSFTWRITRTRNHAGAVAGCPDGKGYLRIGVDGRLYRAHRLAFLYMTGKWPLAEVDHINGRPNDNRWANLRAATPAENQANVDALSSNMIGLRGVTLHRRTGKYRARIQRNGQAIDLGLHATLEEAKEAYRTAAHMLSKGFAR